MKEDIKFPVKYAAMGLEKFSGFVTGVFGLEQDFEVFSYIVAECYLISETKRYYSDGSYKKSYEVVFKWRQSDEDEQIPEFNFYAQCCNSVVVDSVFDEIDDAKNYTRALNKKLIAKRLSVFPVETIIKKIKPIEEEVEKTYELEEKHLVKKIGTLLK